jgi:catechol 2,3-dioxygenase-like lactoylglutathione lyase family enzyme
MVFDHLGFNVTDFAKGKQFFIEALKPLGMAITQEGEGWVMIGRRGEGALWVGSFGGTPGPIHVAFAAANREQVRQFYAAAIAAGGVDNGAPGIRQKYHPNYYGAYVIGPDGHNIEAVCHSPEP